MHDDVTWGHRAGRDDVLGFVDAALSTGARISDVTSPSVTTATARDRH